MLISRCVCVYVCVCVCMCACVCICIYREEEKKTKERKAIILPWQKVTAGNESNINSHVH